MKRRRPDSRSRRAAGAAGVAVALVVLAAAGVALGLRVAGATTYGTALGDIRLRVAPALRGEVDAYVPIADWGVRAYAFRGAFRVHAEPRSIDRSGVLLAAAGERAVLDRAMDDVEDAVASSLRRAALAGMAGALLVAALAALALHASGRGPPRGPRLLAGATVAMAAALAIGSGLLAQATFDPDAFDEPRFYARGSELLQLLDTAEKAERTADRYRTKVQGSLQTFSSLLAEGRVGAETFRDLDDGRRALLASDLHANRLVIEPLRSLAGDDRPVFFVGDFAHEGNEGEARIVAPALAELGPRVYAVSGNHDSTRLMRALARAGVTVLASQGRLRANGSVSGGPVVDVAGLRVAGFSDPLEWRGQNPSDRRRVFGLGQMPDPERARSDAEAALVGWFDALPERPDVVLVHQNGLAQHLARTLATRGPQAPLTVLTGHDHRQHVTRHGDVVVVDAGSVGAGGVLGVTDEQVSVGELHFDVDEPSLEAVDLIGVDPLSGAAQAERVIVAGRRCEDEAEECRLSRE